MDSIPFETARRKHPADYWFYTHEKKAPSWLLSSSRNAAWSITQSNWFCHHLNRDQCVLLALRSYPSDLASAKAVVSSKKVKGEQAKERASITSQIMSQII